MSESLFTAPIGLPIDEQIRQNLAMQKMAGNAVPAAAATVLTNLAPDPTLPGPAGYIPFTGAAENLAGFAGTAYDLVKSAINRGFGTNLPSAPQAPAQHWEDSFNKIFQAMPRSQEVANDPEYDPAIGLGKVMGNLVPLAPGGAITDLGAVGKVVQHLVPTTAAADVNALVGGTLGTGAIIKQTADQDKQEGAFGVKFNNVLNPPQIGAPQRGAAPPSFGSQLDSVLNGGGTTPAPTFSEEKETNWSVGDMVLGFAALVGTLAAARYTHGLGAAVTTAERDARMSNPGFAQQATDYNNQQTAIQGGQQLSGDKVIPPTPNNNMFHAGVTAAKTSVLDETAQLQDYINLTSANPAAAQRLADQVSMTLNNMSWQGRLREFLHTGVDDQTSMGMVAPKKVYESVAALDQDRRETLANGMFAANELDNRKNNVARGVTNPRYDYQHVDDAGLQSYVTAMRNDPELSAIADQFNNIGRRMIDIGEQRGFFSPAEAQRILRDHPNYVPDVDLNGQVMHALGPRVATPQTGVLQTNTTPWSAYAQHIEGMYREFEMNEMRRAFLDHQLDVQKQYPNSPQWLSEVKQQPVQQPSIYPTMGGGTGNPREPIITVRTGAGAKFYRVDSPWHYDILSGNNATKFKTLIDGASWPRRVLSAFTTGTGALLSGRAFPVVNMLRTNILAPMNRSPGQVSGLMDMATQRLTGGRIGWRLPDPTTWVGTPVLGIVNAVHDLGFHVAPMFDKANPSWGTQMLKSIITPQQMDTIKSALENNYLSSTLHEGRAGGMGGQGVPVRVRPPALMRQAGQSGTTVRLVSGEITPQIFMSGGKLGTIRPSIIHARRALEDVFSSISDAGHDYNYWVNKINGTANVRESRALVGDPGVHGSGVVARGVSSLVPYANVSAQGLVRHIESYAKSPVGTTAGLVGGLGSLALLSIFTAMRNDDTKDYLQNVVSTANRAANVYIFNNDNPHINTQFSLPQELRAPYAFLLDVISKALNLAATKHDPEAHDGVLSFLKDWFSEHVENSTAQAMTQGAASAANIVDFPPLAQIPAAIAGGSVHVDLGRIANDAYNGTLGLDSLKMPVGTDSPLPNHPPGDNILEGQDSKKYGAMLSAIFGIFGGTWDNLAGFSRYYHQTNDFWKSLGQVKEDYLQRAMDLNPTLNSVIWENQVRDSMRSPIVESVTRQLDLMKNATAGAKTAERFEGTTGGTRPLPITPLPGDGKVPTNPVMRNLFFATAAEYNYIESRVVNDINQLKKQMANQSQQPGDVQERRQWMNQQTRVIADKYRYIQARIDDLNANLSRQVGAPVDAPHIDWSKGPEQFAR